jgi:hypothetical protein
MNSLLVIQLICAFTPALIGLAIAAATSPRMFRILAKMFQFDLTSLLLVMAALAMLFAMNRWMTEMSHESWREYQRELSYWRQNDPGGYQPSAYSYYARSEYEIGALLCASVFMFPGLIFARLLIDGFRDERRATTVKPKRAGRVATPQSATHTAVD